MIASSGFRRLRCHASDHQKLLKKPGRYSIWTRYYYAKKDRTPKFPRWSRRYRNSGEKKISVSSIKQKSVRGQVVSLSKSAFGLGFWKELQAPLWRSVDEKRDLVAV